MKKNCKFKDKKNNPPTFDDWYINFYNLNEEIETHSSSDSRLENNIGSDNEMNNDNNDSQIIIDFDINNNHDTNKNLSLIDKIKQEKTTKDESNLLNMNNLFISNNRVADRTYDFLGNKFSIFSKNDSYLNSEVNKFSNEFNNKINSKKKMLSTNNLKNKELEINGNDNNFKYFKDKYKNNIQGVNSINRNIEKSIKDNKIEKGVLSSTYNQDIFEKNYDNNDNQVITQNKGLEKEKNLDKNYLKEILFAYSNKLNNEKTNRDDIKYIIDDLVQYFPKKEYLDSKENFFQKNLLIDLSNKLLSNLKKNESEINTKKKKCKRNFSSKFFC